MKRMAVAACSFRKNEPNVCMKSLSKPINGRALAEASEGGCGSVTAWYSQSAMNTPAERKNVRLQA